MYKISNFLSISLILMCLYTQEIAGECCRDTPVRLHYYCEGVSGSVCAVDICADGTDPTPFCGYGKCNIFGCACEGGCRTGSSLRAESVYMEANQHLKFVRH